MPMTRAELGGLVLLELVVMAFVFWYTAAVIQILNYWVAIGFNIMNIAIVLLLVMRQPGNTNTGNGGGRKVPPPLVK